MQKNIDSSKEELQKQIDDLTNQLKDMDDVVFKSNIGRKVWNKRSELRSTLFELEAEDIEIEEEPEREEVIQENILDPYDVPF